MRKQYIFRVVDRDGRDAFMEGENFGRPTYQYRQTYDGISDARAVRTRANQRLSKRAPFRILRASEWEEVE